MANVARFCVRCLYHLLVTVEILKLSAAPETHFKNRVVSERFSTVVFLGCAYFLLHFCTIHAISNTWFWVRPPYFSALQWYRAHRHLVPLMGGIVLHHQLDISQIYCLSATRTSHTTTKTILSHLRSQFTSKCSPPNTHTHTHSHTYTRTFEMKWPIVIRKVWVGEFRPRLQNRKSSPIAVGDTVQPRLHAGSHHPAVCSCKVDIAVQVSDQLVRKSRGSSFNVVTYRPTYFFLSAIRVAVSRQERIWNDSRWKVLLCTAHVQESYDQQSCTYFPPHYWMTTILSFSIVLPGYSLVKVFWQTTAYIHATSQLHSAPPTWTTTLSRNWLTCTWA